MRFSRNANTLKGPSSSSSSVPWMKITKVGLVLIGSLLLLSRPTPTFNYSQTSSFPSGNTGVSTSLSTIQNVEAFQTLNKRMLTEPLSECACGCPDSQQKECGPRKYSLQDVNASAEINYHSSSNNINDMLTKYMDTVYTDRADTAKKECHEKVRVSSTGGYCSSHGTSRMGPNKRFKYNLQEFFSQEKIKSLGDFGAGQGLYGKHLVEAFNGTLEYRGYDGAGDVETATNGFLKFFDLVLPLHLPMNDWVMSIEVGEHIPHSHEAMYIRNLHAHNCKGIVLSWAKTGQGGVHHINCHDKPYLLDIFQLLGYVLDVNATAKLTEKVGYAFLRRNVMVLRRTQPIC